MKKIETICHGVVLYNKKLAFKWAEHQLFDPLYNRLKPLFSPPGEERKHAEQQKGPANYSSPLILINNLQKMDSGDYCD